MHKHRVALKLATAYTLLAVFFMVGHVLMGDDRLLLRLLIFASVAAVLWLGWLWMYAVHRRETTA